MRIVTYAGRFAMRCRHHARMPHFASPIAASAFHSYSLPVETGDRSPNQANALETPVAQPEPIVKSPETWSPNLHPHSSPPSPHRTHQSETEHSTKSKSSRPRSQLRARKAAMKLTPAAVERLKTLLCQPEPKFIKVGVRNRGCSGLAYHLDYVDKPGAFDEMVEQDGVQVLIDSKALFSIIGSEMDWTEDKLSQRFVFKNPNIKEQCGCGESFMV